MFIPDFALLALSFIPHHVSHVESEINLGLSRTCIHGLDFASQDVILMCEDGMRVVPCGHILFITRCFLKDL